MISRSSNLYNLISSMGNDILDKINNLTNNSTVSTTVTSHATSTTTSFAQQTSTAAENINSSSNILSNQTNIFKSVYSCFQNLLYPIGSINSESDFIFAIFNTNNPFDKTIFKNTIQVQLSTQYQYTLNYSATNTNYIFILGLFYLAKQAYSALISNSNAIPSINYYLLPETLTSLDQLSSITYLLNSNIIIFIHSLFYMLSDLGFDTISPNTPLPSRWPIQTLNTMSILISNLFSKLFYSLFVVISSMQLDITPFNFTQFTSPITFTAYQDKPAIFAQCTTCTQWNKLFTSIFSNPVIVSATVNVDTSRPITVNISKAYTWRDVFSSFSVNLTPIYVQFIKPYVISNTLTQFIQFITQLNQIFVIRQDMIVVNAQYGYFIINANDILYARPASFTSIKCLPGVDMKLYSNSYIDSLHNAYNIDKSLFSLYQKYADNYYSTDLFSVISNAFILYKQYGDNTCNYIANATTLSRMHQYVYVYLLYKHIYNSNSFDQKLSFISIDINTHLLAFSFALNSKSQNSIVMNDKYSFNPFSPDLDKLITVIETECTSQFNKLTDKNLSDPYCRCLYRNGTTDLSPYCFDPKCRTSLNDPNTIYKQYECKYPTCSQAFDITNMIASSIDLNNIQSNLSCGAVTTTNVLEPGKYSIFSILLLNYIGR